MPYGGKKTDWDEAYEEHIKDFTEAGFVEATLDLGFVDPKLIVMLGRTCRMYNKRRKRRGNERFQRTEKDR